MSTIGWVVVIIVILLVVAGAYYYYMKKKDPENFAPIGSIYNRIVKGGENPEDIWNEMKNTQERAEFVIDTEPLKKK